MTSERQSRHFGSVRAKNARAPKSQTEPERLTISIDVERSGGWMSREDLRDAVLAALTASGDVALNLQGIGHLDASALQILLALDIEQKKQGRQLHLTNVSAHLRQWFDYSGAIDQFTMITRQNDE